MSNRVTGRTPERDRTANPYPPMCGRARVWGEAEIPFCPVLPFWEAMA